MADAKTPAAQGNRPPAAGERFTVAALAAMAVALAYVYFLLMPGQEHPPDLEFAFENPMLDARPGERVMFFRRSHPQVRSCSLVRPEAVVLRPHRGPASIETFTDLRRALPYLACTIRRERAGEATCEGTAVDTVLYALNYFGMPADTEVRVERIRPRRMRWGERDVTVYETVFQRYGPLGGRWTTYVSADAPVAGLVKWTSLLEDLTEVHYREVLSTGR